MKSATHQTLTRSHREHCVALLLAAVALISFPFHAQAGRENSDPRIIPPGTSFRGLSYGEWGAEWWKSLFSIPVVDGSHPYLDGGIFGYVNGVLFIIGPIGEAIIDLTIPPGTPLLVSVANAECSVLEPDPFHGENETELRACANGHIDNTSGVFAEIDGLQIHDLPAYRSESPLFEFGPLPEDNVLAYLGLDAPVGTTSRSVDAGFYLLLSPPAVGSHTIRVGGTYDNLGFAIDTTFNITVAP